MMAVVKIAVVCVWLCFSVHCQAEEYPQVTFMGNALANHSYLDLSLVGTSHSDSVQCHTDVETCCTRYQGHGRGYWTFPNGTVLPSSVAIYQRSHAQRVDLYRNSGSDSGIYCCNITVNTGYGIIKGFYYIGLYQSEGEYNYYVPMAKWYIVSIKFKSAIAKAICMQAILLYRFLHVRGLNIPMVIIIKGSLHIIYIFSQHQW